MKMNYGKKMDKMPKGKGKAKDVDKAKDMAGKMKMLMKAKKK